MSTHLRCDRHSCISVVSKASNLIEYRAVLCRLFLATLGRRLARGDVVPTRHDHIAARQERTARASSNSCGPGRSPIHPRLQGHLVFDVPLVHDREGDWDCVVIFVVVRRTRPDGQQWSGANISAGQGSIYDAVVYHLFAHDLLGVARQIIVPAMLLFERWILEQFDRSVGPGRADPRVEDDRFAGAAAPDKTGKMKANCPRFSSRISQRQWSPPALTVSTLPEFFGPIPTRTLSGTSGTFAASRTFQSVQSCWTSRFAMFPFLY